MIMVLLESRFEKERILYFPLWFRVLNTIGYLGASQIPCYGNTIQKYSHVHISHVSHIIPKLKEKDIIKIIPKGRVKIIMLTEKGVIIASRVSMLMRDMQK